MNDENIITLYANKNPKAIACTKEKYGKKLLSIANEITNDMNIAEECENDVYMTAWTSLPPDYPSNYFFPYLIRVTKHIALNRRKSELAKKRNGIYMDTNNNFDSIAVPQYNQHDLINSIVINNSLKKFLTNLDFEKRNIFTDKYYHDCAIKDIAKKYNCSETKIKSMLMRIRKKLKEQLEQDGVHVSMFDNKKSYYQNL